MSNGRNVKSVKKETTNVHERSKDFLSDAEIKPLLETSKKKDIQKGTTFYF
ncbi:hypothetical protein MNBD_BACTEROID03-2711 [hydrothermal vent metagenome]|uniref:Uncharacterized protein n=1 Tax=hydrothermal vent metagenome TaxID=652676 RepID=A0A3B0TD67_9ZZZZ